MSDWASDSKPFDRGTTFERFNVVPTRLYLALGPLALLLACAQVETMSAAPAGTAAALPSGTAPPAQTLGPKPPERSTGATGATNELAMDGGTLPPAPGVTPSSMITSTNETNVAPIKRSCPGGEPADGSTCEFAGLTCRYDKPLQDVVCTQELKWHARQFVVPPDGGLVIDLEGEQPEMQPCEAYGSCPADPLSQCSVDCCAGAGSGGGCAACCWQTRCEDLPTDRCPKERCALRRRCDGVRICITPETPEPPCGTPGAWGVSLCCEGLTESCTFKPDFTGRCVGGNDYPGFPVCLACGDGLCEVGENDCNCPEDCASDGGL